MYETKEDRAASLLNFIENKFDESKQDDAKRFSLKYARSRVAPQMYDTLPIWCEIEIVICRISREQSEVNDKNDEVEIATAISEQSGEEGVCTG